MDKMEPVTCETFGHEYVRLDYVYARDEEGIAFAGGHKFITSKLYQRVFCRRCAETTEVLMCPERADRGGASTQKLNLKEPIFKRQAAVSKIG